MSWWTYVHGTVVVSPMGRTQAEKRYILETVLDHLPVVTGSERDMEVYIIQKNGYNSSSSRDEFGCITNNLRDRFGDRNRRFGSLHTQDEYILVVDGSLRDRIFDQTFKEFQKWICRLAKRVDVEKVQVEIKDYDKSVIIKDEYDKYIRMFESTTLTKHANKQGESNWCEYLMWDRDNNSDYPTKLAHKYFHEDNE